MTLDALGRELRALPWWRWLRRRRLIAQVSAARRSHPQTEAEVREGLRRHGLDYDEVAERGLEFLDELLAERRVELCTARPWPSCSRPDGQSIRHWVKGPWTNEGEACS